MKKQTEETLEQKILEAQKYGAKNAIEYLTEIQETNIKNMSNHQWFTLIDVITKNYHNKYIELSNNLID